MLAELFKSLLVSGGSVLLVLAFTAFVLIGALLIPLVILLLSPIGLLAGLWGSRS